jgi:hypothetical protein
MDEFKAVEASFRVLSPASDRCPTGIPARVIFSSFLIMHARKALGSPCLLIAVGAANPCRKSHDLRFLK